MPVVANDVTVLAGLVGSSNGGRPRSVTVGGYHTLLKCGNDLSIGKNKFDCSRNDLKP